jgi:hypothetical protein
LEFVWNGDDPSEQDKKKMNLTNRLAYSPIIEIVHVACKLDFLCQLGDGCFPCMLAEDE